MHVRAVGVTVLLLSAAVPGAGAQSDAGAGRSPAPRDTAALGRSLATSQRAAAPEGVEARLARVQRFAAVARELGTEAAPLAIAWCLKNPNVSSVILGATRPEQLRHNLGALDLVASLDAAAMAKIESAFA